MHGLLLRIIATLTLFCSLPLQASEVKDNIALTQIEPLTFGSVLNMVVSLIVVIALIVAIAWLLKRYGRMPASGSADMRLLGGLSVGTREKVLLLEVDAVRIVIGVAPGRVEKIHVFDNKPSTDSSHMFEHELNEAVQKQ